MEILLNLMSGLTLLVFLVTAFLYVNNFFDRYR